MTAKEQTDKILRLLEQGLVLDTDMNRSLAKIEAKRLLRKYIEEMITEWENTHLDSVKETFLLRRNFKLTLKQFTDKLFEP